MNTFHERRKLPTQKTHTVSIQKPHAPSDDQSSIQTSTADAQRQCTSPTIPQLNLPLGICTEVAEEDPSIPPLKLPIGTRTEGAGEDNEDLVLDREDLEKELMDSTGRAAEAGRAASGKMLAHAALKLVVTGRRAMHPQRAEIGRNLLGKLVMKTAREPAMTGFPLIERLFFDSMPRKYVKIQDIELVVHPTLRTRFLERVIQEGGSVEACFHGTREEYLPQILEQGLLSDQCSTGAYGLGAYMGTHAGVAHQYADPDDKGLRHMCVVLVFVGKKVVVGKEGEVPEATSVDRIVNPTQYCFVDDDRMYVCHVITYRVVGAEPRRIGGGWHDPMQDALSQAQVKAGQRRKKRGAR